MNKLTLLLSMSLIVLMHGASIKTVQKPQKQRVVLMPIKVSEEDRSLSGAMETALVEGLQERYIVFSGDRVQQKTREIFLKESKTAKSECDETKCMEDIAIAFQAELIAVANVTKRPVGYFLSISIQNIFDNKVVYSKSRAYENQNAFQIIDKLRELITNTTRVMTEQPVNNIKGIYLDLSTNLMWQDEEYTREEKNHYDNNSEGGKILHFEHAKEYCENLNFVGYNNWRLPTKDELWELYHKKSRLKSIGWSSNSEELGGVYWSYSEYLPDNIRGHGVSFNNGYTFGNTRSTSRYLSGYVRCVRR